MQRADAQCFHYCLEGSRDPWRSQVWGLKCSILWLPGFPGLPGLPCRSDVDVAAMSATRALLSAFVMYVCFPIYFFQGMHINKFQMSQKEFFTTVVQNIFHRLFPAVDLFEEYTAQCLRSYVLIPACFTDKQERRSAPSSPGEPRTIKTRRNHIVS